MDSVNNCNVIRPLLSISRFETGKLCSFWQLPIYPDISNQKIKFLRNRVRKQLLPIVKFFFNSKVEDVLLQLAEIVEFENQHMNQVAKGLFTSFNSLGCDNSTNVKSTQQNRWVSSFIKQTPLITFLPSLEFRVYQLPFSNNFEKSTARWSASKSLHLFSESEAHFISSDNINTNTTQHNYLCLPVPPKVVGGYAKVVSKPSKIIRDLRNRRGTASPRPLLIPNIPTFARVRYVSKPSHVPRTTFGGKVENWDGGMGGAPAALHLLRKPKHYIPQSITDPLHTICFADVSKPRTISATSASQATNTTFGGKGGTGGLRNWVIKGLQSRGTASLTFVKKGTKYVNRSKANKGKSHSLGQINMIPYFLEEYYSYQRIINKVCESPMLQQKFCSVYKENQFCYLSTGNLSATVISSVDEARNPFSLVMKYKMYSDKTYQNQPINASASQLCKPKTHITSTLHTHKEACSALYTTSTTNTTFGGQGGTGDKSAPPIPPKEVRVPKYSGMVRNLRNCGVVCNVDVVCGNPGLAKQVRFAKLVAIDEALTNWFVAKHIIGKKSFLFNPLAKSYNFSLSFLKSVKFAAPFQSNDLLHKRRLRDSILPASFFSWWITSGYIIFNSKGGNTPFGLKSALYNSASSITPQLRKPLTLFGGMGLAKQASYHLTTKGGTWYMVPGNVGRASLFAKAPQPYVPLCITTFGGTASIIHTPSALHLIRKPEGVLGSGVQQAPKVVWGNQPYIPFSGLAKLKYSKPRTSTVACSALDTTSTTQLRKPSYHLTIEDGTWYMARGLRSRFNAYPRRGYVVRTVESGVSNVIYNQNFLKKNEILELETYVNFINPNLWPLQASTAKSSQKSLVTYAPLNKPKVVCQFFMFSRFSLPIKRINKINKIKTSFWIWNKRVHSTKMLNNVSKNFPKIFSGFAKEGIECVLLSRSIKDVLPFTFSWTNRWNVPLVCYTSKSIAALPHNINTTYVLNNIFLNNTAKQAVNLHQLRKPFTTSTSQVTLPSKMVRGLRSSGDTGGKVCKQVPSVTQALPPSASQTAKVMLGPFGGMGGASPPASQALTTFGGMGEASKMVLMARGNCGMACETDVVRGTRYGACYTEGNAGGLRSRDVASPFEVLENGLALPPKVVLVRMLALIDSTRQSINKVAKEKYIEDILTYNFFIYFDKLKTEKKENYWPILISFLPIAFQRRVTKLFLINQNWKKIRYLQVESFLAKKKSYVK